MTRPNLSKSELPNASTVPPVQDEHPEPKINPAINFSVSRYVFSIGIFVAIVLLGLLSLPRLGVDLLPSFEVPVLAVSTGYSGASPDQVDLKVSRKIEDAVSTLSGVSDISSTSVSGQSAVIITYQNGTNIDSAANAVSQAVAGIRGTLPSDADAPVVQKFDPNAQPIITLALLGGAEKISTLSTYATDKLKPLLERVNGVADVTVSGGPSRQVQVLLDPQKLQSYNLTPARVISAIQGSALDLPAGNITQNGTQVGFSTRNTPTSTADVQNILVDSQSGVRVSDIGTVRDTAEDASAYARLNGQPAVLLSIRKASGTNSVSVVDNVRAAATKALLPGSYKLVAAKDDTQQTRSSVNDTYKEFFIGIAAVALVVLLFLGRLNTVFAVVLAIPISVSAAPLLYSLMGFTLNIISLLAIIVAIGIVVDDSIVVAENVQRYRDKGYSIIRSVILGGSEVFSAVTAASFSLLAVLIPLSFMPGILGQFFRQFGLGLAAAITLSWLESLLFLTVRMAYTTDPEPISWRGLGQRLASLPRLLRWGVARRTLLSAWGIIGLVVFALAVLLPISRQTGPVAFVGILLYPLVLVLVRYILTALLGLLEALTGTLHGWTDGVVNRVAAAYARSIAYLLPRNGWVLLVGFLFLASLAIPIRHVGFAFTPKSDTGQLSITLTMPPSASLGQTNAVTSRMERYLLARPEIKLVSTSVSGQTSDVNVTLIPKAQRQGIDTLVETYRKALNPIVAGIVGSNLVVGAQQNGPGGSYDISLALTAPNQADLVAKNRQVVSLLSSDANISVLKSSLSETRQELNFVPNQATLSGSGLTTSDLASALRSYNQGSKSGTLRDGDDSIDIVVRLDPALVGTEQALLSQTVYSQALGANLPLSSLGSFRLQEAPATLNRYNKAYTATININLKPGAPSPFAYQKDIIKRVTDAGLLKNGGTLGDASSFGSSALTGDLVFYGPLVLVLAILLTYLVLGSQFNSFRYPLYLQLPVPLAIVGAVWALWIFGASLDVITILGMVILLGLATKNAILYLEFVTDRMKTMPIFDALVEAAQLRFRPILMTTLTVLVISIPLVFGQGDGAEFRRGLGIVILGGVVTSTLLTFYIVPSVFYRFEKDRSGKRREQEEGEGAGTSGLLPASD
ncbi:efflux RND transporter permease subunit [Deinococcus sp. KNUC1210]|uniref:efflux RND transporter permease subunit n=1 Tax=Deinococcus sp. KNUC1210 TaxID=2917691 RepID=UPI001EF09D15|nr:efflux RND transporter permease subunit [Deinococcus sp. KNUC1210]ULH15467.1 efflux RND transporter permease subunit [Deinococcus sp. KNUC1210]